MGLETSAGSFTSVYLLFLEHKNVFRHNRLWQIELYVFIICSSWYENDSSHSWQLNCVCDTTAKGAVQWAITTGYISTPTQMLPREDVAIVIWGNKITSDVSHPVQFHASKEVARRILADTKMWPQDRFDEVDWGHLDLAMSSKSDM
jgi:hypothetical protein